MRSIGQHKNGVLPRISDGRRRRRERKREREREDVSVCCLCGAFGQMCSRFQRVRVRTHMGIISATKSVPSVSQEVYSESHKKVKENFVRLTKQKHSVKLRTKVYCVCVTRDETHTGNRNFFFK